MFQFPGDSEIPYFQLDDHSEVLYDAGRYKLLIYRRLILNTKFLVAQLTDWGAVKRRALEWKVRLVPLSFIVCLKERKK